MYKPMFGPPHRGISVAIKRCQALVASHINQFSGKVEMNVGKLGLKTPSPYRKRKDCWSASATGICVEIESFKPVYSGNADENSFDEQYDLLEYGLSDRTHVPGLKKSNLPHWRPTATTARCGDPTPKQADSDPGATLKHSRSREATTRIPDLVT